MRRKKRSKRIALTLVLAMAVSGMLAGCGNSKEETAQKTETAQAGQTGTEANNEISQGLDHSKEIEITMMVAEASGQTFPIDNAVVEAVKEKFNVSIELLPIPTSDFDTKVSTILASGEMPDVIGGVVIEDVMKFASYGMFLDLSDYKEFAPDYFNLIYAEDRVDETKKFEVDGDIFGFKKLEYNRIPVAASIAIRTDLLEEQNIPAPTTFEEYYAALLKIKEKHPDMYGFSSRKGTNYLIGSFAYSLGTGGYPLYQTAKGIYYEPQQDAYVYGPTSEKFVRVVEFLQNAYADGLLDPDYASMNKDTMFEKLSNGKMMSVYDNNTFVGRVYNPALKEIDENARFDILEPLADEDGNVRSYRYEKDWSNNNAVISSRVSELERIVEVFNWLYTEEGRMISNFGIEGIDYTVEDGEIITSQELIDANKDASDIAAAVRGQLGAGLDGMAQYIDESLDAQITDAIMVEQGELISKWTKEGKIDYYPLWPPFTEEETSRVASIESALNNIFDQEIDAFITGKKSMDEWPALVEKLESQGTAELEQIYNDAYARLK